MVFSLLADGVVFIHLLWIVFLILGAIPGVRYGTVKILHFSGLGFAVLIQVIGVYCPLTYIEVWLRMRSDPVSSYSGSFLSHYIERIVYLEVSRSAIFIATVLLIVFNIVIYRRGRTHKVQGKGKKSE